MARSGGSKRKTKRRKWRPDVQPPDPFPPGYGVGPLGPVGQIESVGRIAWAAKHGTGRQRRAGLVFLLLLGAPVLIALLYLVLDWVF